MSEAALFQRDEILRVTDGLLAKEAFSVGATYTASLMKGLSEAEAFNECDKLADVFRALPDQDR